MLDLRPVTIPVLLTLILTGCSADRPEAGEAPDQPTPESGGVEVLVPGSHFHGIHGLTVAPDGDLLAGSVVGSSIYRVDPETGTVETFLGPPLGMADDLEFSPDEDRLVWTSFLLGKVHAATVGGEGPGEVVELADGLPGANSVAWRADGRLFFTQVFLGDALWEADPEGVESPRKVAENLGGLNGFDFGDDGLLYGPLWFEGRVVSVDVDTAEVTTVADGFGTPAAVNFDPQGRLWVVDTLRGEVVRIDLDTGAKTVVADVDPSIDNLAFAPDGRLFITNMAHNAIYEIDTESGEQRTVVEGGLAMPGALGVWSDDGTETLYLADTFAYRTIDTATGEVQDVRLMHGQSLEELDYPVYAAVDEEHVVLTSWSSSTVQVVDRRSGESLEMLHGFETPVAGLRLPDGRLVVAEAVPQRLLAVSPGGERERTTLVDELGLPAALALSEDGATIWVSVVGAEGGGSVVEVDVATGEKTEIASGLALPEGLDVLPDGRLAVAEVGARRLVAVDPESGDREVLAEDLPVGLEPPPGMLPTFVPTGVAAGAGAVYVTSDVDNSILRIALD